MSDAALSGVDQCHALELVIADRRCKHGLRNAFERLLGCGVKNRIAGFAVDSQCRQRHGEGKLRFLHVAGQR